MSSQIIEMALCSGSNGTILKYAYTHPLTVSQGWNLISLPASVTVNLKQILFPSATSPAFTYTETGYQIIVTSNYYAYEGGYTIADTIKPGQGYWVKTSAGGKLILSSIK